MTDPNNVSDFLKYITKISKKLKHSKLSITVYNCSNKLEYDLSSNAKNRLDKYYIVFTDGKYVNQEPDKYYCNTVQELEDMLTFICKNHKIYETKLSKYDALENIYTDSLDYYVDNELDDASAYDTYNL